MTIDIITVRGTGELWNSNENMLANVTHKLDLGRFRYPQDLYYPATVGPAGGPLDSASETANIEAGIGNLAATIRRTPNVAGLLGYSLGAMVISRFLERKALGDFSDCEVAFVGLIANPLRREGDSVDDLGIGYGIAGQRGQAPARIAVYEIANPFDAITSCPADSPLRTLADQAAAFSFADLGGWNRDLMHRLMQPTIGGESPEQVSHAYLFAAAQVAGYLAPAPYGHHTAYGYATMPGQPPGVTYCDRLAQLINEGPWR